LRFNQKLILIALAGTFLAVFWQELNASFLDTAGNYRYGLIETADEASYLSPPKNLIDHGFWADNSIGLSRYYQRPPGYGMIFGIFYFFMGKQALLGLKILQIIAFFFTLYFSGKILHHLIKNDKWTYISTTILAIIPIYSGFMYYTLTEALTPFLLIWSIQSYLTTLSMIRMSIPFALLLLVRPQLMIFPLVMILLSLLKKEKMRTISIAIAFIPLIIWMLRTTIITGEYQGIHPIYSDTNISLYRPGHAALTDLFKIWEGNGERFHETIACVSNTQDNKALKKCSNHVPKAYMEKTQPLLEQYNRLLHRKDYGLSEQFKTQERIFVQKVNATRDELVRQNRFTYHILTPFKSAVYLLSKSQLNLFIYQETFRGNFLMELIRWISLLLINLGMISLVVQILRRRTQLIVSLSFASLGYFFYLIYFQRMNEDRYLSPLLPLLFIVLIVSIYETRSLQLKEKKMDPK
jgi:hypothetical protein